MKPNVKGNALITMFIVIITLVGLYLLWLFIFSVKIEAGVVGIKVNMYGSSNTKGVQVDTLKAGRNYYNPITTDVYKYATFVQQKEYNNIRFQDLDGLVISANIGMDYKFNEELVPKIFEEYRASSTKITNEYMTTWLKNSINRAASEFKVDELYGAKKEDFRLKVLEYIKTDFDSKGIIVNNVYFVGDMELPPQVMTRINAKIEATQNAMQKENELRAVEADAKKQIEEARGISEATIIKAKAEAEKIKIQAQAIQAQGGAEYVQLQYINKWDGHLPTTVLGDNASPLINMIK